MQRPTPLPPALIIVAMLATALAVAPALRAQPAAAQPGATQPADAAAAEAIPVAVLDFDAQDPTQENLGQVIGETIAIMLAGEPGLRIVDCSTLARTLQEHELNLSGLVETEQALQVGKLVGARIIVVGKAFPLGQRMFLTAKLIGTETSLVDGVIVKGDAQADMDVLVLSLAEKVAQRLSEAGPKLVASEATVDPLPALQAALAGRALPTVAVVVTEQHLAGARAGAAPDPAVETEIKRLLLACGVPVKDVAANALADWAQAREQGEAPPWPQGLGDVDLVITGEAFSEFAARIGNLNSCNARAEINMIERGQGRIVLADRATSRAIDLSEQQAGKTALEKAGRTLAIRVLEHLVDHTAPQQ